MCGKLLGLRFVVLAHGDRQRLGVGCVGELVRIPLARFGHQRFVLTLRGFGLRYSHAVQDLTGGFLAVIGALYILQYQRKREAVHHHVMSINVQVRLVTNHVDLDPVEAFAMDVHRAGKGFPGFLPLVFRDVQNVHFGWQTVGGAGLSVGIFHNPAQHVGMGFERVEDGLLQTGDICIFREFEHGRTLVVDMLIYRCLAGIVHAQLALT